MYGISIAPADYYPDGGLVSFDWLDSENTVKRAIRSDVALDNQVVVTDSGFSWGDRQTRVIIRYKKSFWDKLQLWLMAYPNLVICRQEGVFLSILKDAKLNGNFISLNLGTVDKL